MEALEFFKKSIRSFGKDNVYFAPNHFNGVESARKFIKKLYKLGATKVNINCDIDGSFGVGETEVMADELIVCLPNQIFKRLDLVVAIFEEYPDEVSSLFNPFIDNNEDLNKVNWRTDKYIRLWWD